MSRVSLILAATVPELGIGLNGNLPWRLAKDMKFFRDITTGKNRDGVVIMGRTTWESIPPKFRPLKDRTNIVVTSKALDGVITATSYENALDKADQNNTGAGEHGDIWIIGGGMLYKAAKDHPRTKHVLLTEIEGDVKCDTFFEGFPWYARGDSPRGEWIRQDHDKLESFVGEKVQQVVQENGLTCTFTLWNKL